MLQCMQATVPLVEILIKGEPKEYFGEKCVDVCRLKRFTEEYHGGKGGDKCYGLTPSEPLAIISKKKHYFGNYSQQDTYDAFLTMVDALTVSQKKLYQELHPEPKIPLPKIPDNCIPIGQVYSFFLRNKRIYFNLLSNFNSRLQ